MRLLVVDDSTLFRKVVRDALLAEPGVEVVGSAANGRVALEKIEQLSPDAITLDLEMPELDGLEVLRRLQGRPTAPSVIVISALTDAGAEQTTQALRLGAFDFVLKPNGPSIDANLKQLQADLLPKIRLLAERKHLELPGVETAACRRSPAPAKVGAMLRRPEIVAIGVSTGGPAALARLLPQLPGDFPLPIVVVQHMPPKFTRSLAEDLDRNSSLHVKEAEDSDRLQRGTVYIAPGGSQMKVECYPRGLEIRITDDPPEKSCKPSVDYLFRSLAEGLGPRVVGVIMTGMGDDGAEGCRLLKARGARILAQDAASCVVYGMPRQVVEQGLADIVRPLDQLSEAILDQVLRSASTC